jgi:DNA polymerase V
MNDNSFGVPSSFANGYFEPIFDLNYDLIKNPVSTFYGRVKGYSMKDAGVDDGDLLIIDKSLEYQNGAMVVCYLNGEFTLKRIKREKGKLYLMPANENYQPIPVSEEAEFIIWGIVTYIVKKAV